VKGALIPSPGPACRIGKTLDEIDTIDDDAVRKRLKLMMAEGEETKG